MRGRPMCRTCPPYRVARAVIVAVVSWGAVFIATERQQTTSESVETSEGILRLSLSGGEVSTDSQGRMFFSGKGGISALRDGELTIYFSGDLSDVGQGVITLATGTEARRFTVTAATTICNAAGVPIGTSTLTSGMPVTVMVLPKAVDQAAQISGGYISVGPLRLGPMTPVHPVCAQKSAVSPVAQNRERIREIQRLLSALGFDPGAIDGLPGAKTTAAAAAFQKKFGYAPKAQLNEELLGQLRGQEKRSLRPPGSQRF